MTLPIDNLLIERQFARLPVTQATANSTKTLTVADAPIQHFTGSTAGQIVQLPNATTLLNGTMYEVLNASTVPVRVNDGAGSPALLTWISQTRRARLTLIDNSTQAGVWSVDANYAGANFNYAESAGPTTNNSNTVWVNAVTLTTENLPLADYEIAGYSLFSAAANNRGPEYRITVGGVQIGDIQSLFAGPTGGTKGYHSFDIFIRAQAISGVNAVNLEFRNNGAVGNSTITVIKNRLRLFRI